MGTTEKTYAKFCVKTGNTVDFSLNFSGGADSVVIWLKKNTVLAAEALLDTNTRNRNLIWRERAVDKDYIYEVTLKGKASVNIAANAFQWSFKTFGPGYLALVSPNQT